MATLTGTSAEREAKAKTLTDAELTEIAEMNDFASALKARAELARRQGLQTAKTLFWARFAGAAAILAIVVTIAVELLRR